MNTQGRPLPHSMSTWDPNGLRGLALAIFLCLANAIEPTLWRRITDASTGILFIIQVFRTSLVRKLNIPNTGTLKITCIFALQLL